jgi:hypothetical protein
MASIGVPQGLASSPVLFARYMDHLLKRDGLMQYKINAYADDLVFTVNTPREASEVIKKLERFHSHLRMNKKRVV